MVLAAIIGCIFVAIAWAGFFVMAARANRLNERRFTLGPSPKVADYPVKDGRDVFHAADAARRVH